MDAARQQTFSGHKKSEDVIITIYITLAIMK